MIFISFCFQEAAANTLTNPALDPFGKIPELKYCSARVEKVDAENLEVELLDVEKLDRKPAVDKTTP